MKDRTAIACTAVLAATLLLCTWYLGNIIEDAAAQISSDDSDDGDALQRTVHRVGPLCYRADAAGADDARRSRVSEGSRPAGS